MPTMKKIVETEPEPPFTEVAESSRVLELLVSVNADYCKYKCRSEIIQFKDTLMLQTRVYELSLHNRGTISLDYNWQVVMESMSNIAARSVTFAAEAPSTHRPMTAGTEMVRLTSEFRVLLQCVALVFPV